MVFYRPFTDLNRERLANWRRSSSGRARLGSGRFRRGIPQIELRAIQTLGGYKLRNISTGSDFVGHTPGSTEMEGIEDVRKRMLKERLRI